MPRREDIEITFGGDDSRFNKVAKRVGRTGAALKRQFQSLGESIAGFFGFGVGLGGAGLAAGVAQLTSDLDELGKTATSLNTTVESLHQLRFAISQTSTLTDRQFNTVLQKLIKHIGHANRGAKESQKIFEELGLSWEYLASLQSDQAFLEVVDALNRIPDAYKRAGVSQKLFEESWRELTPTIMAGREELERLMGVQQQMGGPTTEAAEAAAKFNDALGELRANLSSLVYELAPPVLQFFSDLGARIRQHVGEFTEREELLGWMQKLDEQIDEIQKRLKWMEGTQHENSAAAEKLREKLKFLKEEYWATAKAINDMDAAARKAESRPSASPIAPPPPVVPQPKKAGGSGVPSGPEGPITTAGAASMRSEALRKFREGEITQAELYAEMARIEFEQGKITEGELKSLEALGQEAYRSTEGDINLVGPGPGDQVTIKIGFDKEKLNEDFRKWSEQNEIIVKVRPELVADAGIEISTVRDAHKSGGHP